MAGKKTFTKGLTENEKRFCEEYLVDFNGTKAAIRAGYSQKTATSQASRLLTKVKVQNFLAAKKAKAIVGLEISAQRTMNEIARLAYSDIRKVFDDDGFIKNIKDLDDDTAAALSAIETDEVFSGTTKKKIRTITNKMKLWPKDRALEMLAKHFNLYTDAPQTPLNLFAKKVTFK